MHCVLTGSCVRVPSRRNGGVGAASLALREDPHRGVFVEGLTEVAVRSPQEVWALAAKGQRARQTAATRLNDVSSRSHAVFTVVIEQRIVDKRDKDASKDAGKDAHARAPTPPALTLYSTYYST